MPVNIDKSGSTWTYGVEHELADWDTRKGWPDGFGRDPEPNICNSNGIAADPSLRFWPFGAEINTPPSDTVDEQLELFRRFLRMHKDAKANWRCGLHVHIRVPGLSKSLSTLKRLAKYINNNSSVYDLIDPLPQENMEEHGDNLKEARKRYNWMRMSHFTRIPDYRVEAQQNATTLKEFFELEVPKSKAGRPLYHAQPRAAVNLRQLLQTDTIEFRHFPQTLELERVRTAIEWCRDYLMCFFGGGEALDLFETSYMSRDFPELDTIYVHWQEVRWLATTPNKNSLADVRKNIELFLKEDGDERLIKSVAS